MATTLQSIITSARERLIEGTARFWSDAELLGQQRGEAEGGVVASKYLQLCPERQESGDIIHINAVEMEHAQTPVTDDDDDSP